MRAFEKRSGAGDGLARDVTPAPVRSDSLMGNSPLAASVKVRKGTQEGWNRAGPPANHRTGTLVEKSNDIVIESFL